MFHKISLKNDISGMIHHVISQCLGNKDKSDINSLNVDIPNLIINKHMVEIANSLFLILVILLCKHNSYDEVNDQKI